jgi:hypothetical protein|tara:strand:- start:77 stop:337 length:261 start_codon:yes stop_codon:yes gene_type:complete
MIIKLNNKDIHSAIRSLLQDQNIIDSYTEVETVITVGRGKNAGVSAEVTILDNGSEPSLESTDKKAESVKPPTALFNDETEVSEES